MFIQKLNLKSEWLEIEEIKKVCQEVISKGSIPISGYNYISQKMM